MVRVDVGVTTALLTTHREAKLGYSADTYRHDHDSARQCRNQERDGDGHLTTCREEVDAHITRVLSNEINQRDAEDNGDDDADPRGGGASMTKVLITAATITNRRDVSLRHRRFGTRSILVFALAHTDLILSQSSGSSEQVSSMGPSELVLYANDTAVTNLRTLGQRDRPKAAVHHDVRQIVTSRVIERSAARHELK